MSQPIDDLDGCYCGDPDREMSVCYGCAARYSKLETEECTCSDSKEDPDCPWHSWLYEGAAWP